MNAEQHRPCLFIPPLHALTYHSSSLPELRSRMSLGVAEQCVGSVRSHCYGVYRALSNDKFGR